MQVQNSLGQNVDAFVQLDGAGKIVTPPGSGNTLTPTANSKGGTLATASTDVTVLPANPARKLLFFQNTDAAAIILLNIMGISPGAANAANIKLNPGGSLMLDTAVTGSAVIARSTTAGAAYTVIEA